MAIIQSISLNEDIYEKLKKTPNKSALVNELLRNYFYSGERSEDPRQNIENLELKKKTFLESIETQKKQFEKEIQEKARQKETNEEELEKEKKIKEEFDKKAELRAKDFVRSSLNETFKRYTDRDMTDLEYNEFLELNKKEKTKMITFANAKKNNL